jgi:hypothetical protein
MLTVLSMLRILLTVLRTVRYLVVHISYAFRRNTACAILIVLRTVHCLCSTLFEYCALCIMYCTSLLQYIFQILYSVLHVLYLVPTVHIFRILYCILYILYCNISYISVLLTYSTSCTQFLLYTLYLYYNICVHFSDHSGTQN